MEARPLPPLGEQLAQAKRKVTVTWPMPLHVYPNIRASGSVPSGWKPNKGGALKYPVRNAVLQQYLQQLLAGKWQKVVKYGNTGEVHYFEHESGQVADVKFFPAA